jgi:hypothetical protein
MLARAVIAAALLSAPLALTGSSAAGAPGDDSIPVHLCQADLRLPGGGFLDLEVSKSFREDGSVASMLVRLQDNQAGAVRLLKPDDRAFVQLDWPGEHRLNSYGEPFDWSRGSILINFIAADREANFGLLPGEKWRQVVIDRDGSALVHEADGIRILTLSLLDTHLTSGLGHPSSPGRLSMSLDSFLAWGSGVETVRVYETRVKRREPVAHSNPDSPVGRMRVVGVYDVDVAAVGRAAAAARTATEQWEAGLSDSWRDCARTTEGGQIHVGANRIESR